METNLINNSEDEEQEEALSLRDLPLDSSTPSKTRRSSSEPPAELFEFLSSSEYYMCPAEELIFCGRLIPSHHQPAAAQNRSPPPYYPLRRRRSESLSDSVSTRSNSIKTSGSGYYNNGLLRNSRSLDYQKLRRLSSSRTSPDSDMDRNPSVKRSEKIKPGFNVNVNVKPRWYLFMFGIAKFPPEMDLRDIKSRQFRRNSSSVMMFPSESDPIKGSGKNNSWKFLKALSCKDHASIAVTTPFYVPHV